MIAFVSRLVMKLLIRMFRSNRGRDVLSICEERRQRGREESEEERNVVENLKECLVA